MCLACMTQVGTPVSVDATQLEFLKQSDSNDEVDILAGEPNERDDYT